MNRRLQSRAGTVLASVVAILVFPRGTLAQFSANYQTNIIAGVTSNWVGNGTYVVGSNTFRDHLRISADSVLSNGTGYVGYTTGGSNNSVLVIGSASFWNNANGLYVGYHGTQNSLVISNGGVVKSPALYIGFDAAATNNQVTIGRGNLTVTNASGSGLMRVRSGTLTLDSGSLLVDQLVLTNTVVAFNAGTLTTRSGSTVRQFNTTQDLNIGTTPGATAVWNMKGGTNSVMLDLSTWITLGGVAGATGDVNVVGPGTVLLNPSGIWVGRLGGGNQLLITNGAVVQTGFFSVVGNVSNTVRVVGLGSRWSSSGTVLMGGFGNSIGVADGAVVQSGTLEMGGNPGDAQNTVLVSGTNAAWMVASDLYVGSEGSLNELIISNGAVVECRNGYLGYYDISTPSTGNRVTVTGGGSLWTNDASIVVGYNGTRNALRIQDGARVVARGCSIGAGNSSNDVLVTGAGSELDLPFGLGVGQSGMSNQVTVADGGNLRTDGSVQVGLFSSNNRVILTNNATMAASAVQLGSFSFLSSNNVLSIDTSSLAVTNAGNTGGLDIQAGSLRFSSGTITVDKLSVTNGTASAFNFVGGTLHSGGAIISDALPFIVGNGVNAATYHLLGGIHSFDNGLRIRNAASLTGCGTINGTVVVDAGGTVLIDCGGTLTLTGMVTNNGTMRAINGSVLESYGAVVNNGTIDVINGATNFHGVFINNGTVLDASRVRISGVSRSANDVVIQIPSFTNHAYQMQMTPALSPSSWTDSGTGQGGTGGVLTFTDPSGLTNKPGRFYHIEVTGQ